MVRLLSADLREGCQAVVFSTFQRLRQVSTFVHIWYSEMSGVIRHVPYVPAQNTTK